MNRQLIKYLVLVSCLLISSLAYAGNYFLLSATADKLGATNWANWNEGSETTLTGVSLVTLYENPSNGGNETGVSPDGALSGANLTFTQVGTVAGATGTPPRRALDGGDDKFNWNEAGLETIMVGNGKVWSMVWKLSEITNRTKYICMFQDAANNNYIVLYIQVDGTLLCTFKHNGVTDINIATAGAVPTTGTVYVFFESTGSVIRWGFSTTKPTVYSAITANNKGSSAVVSNVTNLDTYYTVLGQGGGAGLPVCNAFYYVARTGATILQ